MQIWLRLAVFALGFLAQARGDSECEDTVFDPGQASWNYNLNQSGQEWSMVRDWKQCQELCRKRPECTIWKITNWSTNESSNASSSELYQCWLKSSRAEIAHEWNMYVPFQNPGVSGKICRTDPSAFVAAKVPHSGHAATCQDIVLNDNHTSDCGHDNESCGVESMEVSDWNECQQRCKVSSKCFVWTFFTETIIDIVQSSVDGRQYEFHKQLRWCLLKTSEARVEKSPNSALVDQNRTGFRNFSGLVSGTGLCPVQPLGSPDVTPSLYLVLLSPLLVILLVLLLPMPCLGTKESMVSSMWQEISRSRRLQDPAYGAITFDQLLHLQEKAKRRLGDKYQHATMHDINSEILQPLCEVLGKSYAHCVNMEHDLKPVQVFVSHSWNENFDEFVTSIQTGFASWPVKPNLWICATALVQSKDASAVSAQVGTGIDPSKAPFTRAMARAEKLLVVRNSNDDIYNRIWCCWELYIAHKLGLLDNPGSLIIVGPPSVDSHVDIAASRASFPDDKQKILEHVIRHENGCGEINEVLSSVKGFANFRTRTRKLTLLRRLTSLTSSPEPDLQFCGSHADVESQIDDTTSAAV